MTSLEDRLRELIGMAYFTAAEPFTPERRRELLGLLAQRSPAETRELLVFAVVVMGAVASEAATYGGISLDQMIASTLERDFGEPS